MVRALPKGGIWPVMSISFPFGTSNIPTVLKALESLLVRPGLTPLRS